MYALIIWSVVAVSSDNHGMSKLNYDWRPLIETQTYSRCLAAAHELLIPTERFRCVKLK